MEFVDLNRSFAAISKDTEPNLTLGRVWGRRIGGWLDWSDLLDRKRVVLLAEASSGKSAEFENTAAALRKRNSSAFYCTIEQLADNRFLSGFDAVGAAALNSWKAGTEQAWFFLDSVDEARLNRKRFDDALRCLSRELGTTLSRAHVLVSCRISDWKGNADRDAFLSILPIVTEPEPQPPPKDPDAALLDPIFAERKSSASEPEEKTEVVEPLVVQLIPLSSEQRRMLAAAAGVSDPKEFVEAIERTGLDTLAERPGDLLELADYWNSNSRFGSLAEMTEHAITRKLSEIDKYRPDNTALPLKKARAGAELIAAALTLGKSFTLRTPAQEPDPELAAGALNPAAILDEWSESEINALLRRGIFTPSTYGRVRFHHRVTQEYLTAQWFHQLLQAGCPLEEIFDVLFADRYGVQTVVPSLRAAAAWLALEQPEVLDEIIRREPLMLIQHGDPGSLPTATKELLLSNLAKRHAAGEIADDNVDNRALWMFASPELAQAIRKAWAENERADFRFDLLRLIREGRIAECSDLAHQVALDKSARDYHRMVAAEALEECGDHRALADLARRFRRNPSAVRPKVAAEFATVLFPKHLMLTDLLSIIALAPPQPKYSTNGFGSAVTALWERCPATDHDAMIAGLADLCSQEPFVSDYQRISARHAELASNLVPIARSVLTDLGEAEPSDALIALLAVIERSERQPRLDDEERPLSEIVRQGKAVQRALFWHDVHDVRARGNAVTSIWSAYFGGEQLWGFGPEDLPWLYDDMLAMPLEDDRRVAFSAVLLILRDQKTLRRKARSLRSRIADHKTLIADLDTFLAPAPKRPSEDADRKARKRRREAEQKEAKESWRKFREKLVSDSSQLNDPAKLRARNGWLPLFNLTKWLRDRTDKEPIPAALQWRLLQEAFTPEVVEAYRTGMCQIWRLTKPERPEQRTGGGTTVKWITILSFAGLAVEASLDPQWAVKLNADEARRAALHGCLSEQEYPEWIDALLLAHSDVVLPIVRETFETEWLSDESVQTYFIYRYSREGIENEHVSREALATIIAHEPKRLLVLDYGLRILSHLQLSDKERARLRRMALARLKKHAKRDSSRSIRYIAVLFIVDGSSGISALVNWLKTSPAKRRKERAEQTVGLLFGIHDPLVSASLRGASVPVLEELLRFAYAHIRFVDDNVHEGSYSPDSRDDAESGRSAVLRALLDAPGPEAHAAMLRLSYSRVIGPLGLRFRELARGMAERDTESPAWTPIEILTMERQHLLPIKSADDLYRIVLGVLDEIAWGFDHDDASSRAVLETARDEAAVQQWLADQLRLRARTRYHVHRESEVAEGNMPDIVVSATAGSFEVAVEAKHSDKGWTVATLRHAIKEQLAEDYLRPASRRHGVFVITRHKKKSWRDPDTRKSLDFGALIETLSQSALKLKKNRAGPISVAVRGIDAAPRPRRRSRAGERLP